MRFYGRQRGPAEARDDGNIAVVDRLGVLVRDVPALSESPQRVVERLHDVEAGRDVSGLVFCLSGVELREEPVLRMAGKLGGLQHERDKVDRLASVGLRNADLGESLDRRREHRPAPAADDVDGPPGFRNGASVRAS